MDFDSTPYHLVLFNCIITSHRQPDSGGGGELPGGGADPAEEAGEVRQGSVRGGGETGSRRPVRVEEGGGEQEQGKYLILFTIFFLNNSCWKCFRFF